MNKFLTKITKIIKSDWFYKSTVISVLVFLAINIFNQKDIIKQQQNLIKQNSINDRELLSYTNYVRMSITLIQDDIVNLSNNTDVLESRLDTINKSIDSNEKRKKRIEKVIQAIKETLPNGGNPLEGCRLYPTSGEIYRIASAVIDMSDRYVVDPTLVMAVIRQESAFCNSAKSPVGAKGYMQLMPNTAAQVAVDIGTPLKTWRGRDNIHLGTAYLSQMLVEFNGNIDLAIAAYNAGPNHVKRVVAGVIPEFYNETINYIIRVKEFQKTYQKIGLY